MSHQGPSTENGSEPESSSTPVEITQPWNPPTAKPTAEQELAAMEKDMNSFERATIKWAKLAVIMAGVAAVFVCAQWYEMHTGGQDTHELAVHAKEQADKMKDMSDAADKIRLAAEGMVAQEQRIADQAGKALNASISASRNDQRAWLGIWIAHIYPIDGNSKIRTEIELVNTGK